MVLSAGDVVGPVEVCELASIRRAFVHVYQKPVVAIMSTGDELSDFYETSSPGKTMCSTLYGLAAQVIETGAVPLLLGIAPDSPREQQELLSEGMRAHVVITSGGLSRGKYDFVRETFRAMGVDIKFRNIAMKPGKPAVFGAMDKTLIFGFPGNPSATMISFEQFVKPALLKMMGRRPGGEARESLFSGIDSFRLDVLGGKLSSQSLSCPVQKACAGRRKTALKPECWFMDVFKRIPGLLAEGENLVLAVIASKSGSAPRGAGARMVVRGDGSIIGTIGGGLIEAQVQRLAEGVFRDGEPVFRKFVLSARDAAEMSMICGGEVEVLIHLIEASDPSVLAVYQQAAEALLSRKRAWLITRIPSRRKSGRRSGSVPREK